jgi:hypothetical protein
MTIIKFYCYSLSVVSIEKGRLEVLQMQTTVSASVKKAQVGADRDEELSENKVHGRCNEENIKQSKQIVQLTAADRSSRRGKKSHVKSGDTADEDVEEERLGNMMNSIDFIDDYTHAAGMAVKAVSVY